MDYPEAELIARRERVEQVLEDMKDAGDRDAYRVCDGTRLMHMKRDCIINLVLNEGSFVPPTLSKAFVGMDIPAFVKRIRVQVAIARLS